ncbi:hypothetical protein E4T56_gene11637 [Termitomyces sp. T112]|nr:hypothetical protein E4T56_gene11637 [Termitomyces sp. T112]
MCCHSFSLPATGESNTACVDENILPISLTDAHWIEAFPFKAGDIPDIIAYGLGKASAIKLLSNPLNNGSHSDWKVNEIAILDFPVCVDYADLTGNGCNDVIIVDRYGPSMNDLWDADTENGGRIQWLRNPGDRDSRSAWEAHTIGNSTGMHRIRAGHFTTTEHIQVLAFPISPKSSDFTSPAPVLVFTPVYSCSDLTQGPTHWIKDIAFDSEFRLIHDAKLLPKTNENLDMILAAGREGLVLFWFDKPSQVWKYNVVSEGLPQSGNNPYWGSGSVDICRVGDDTIGYIATCEAFHGNIVSVYVKKPDAPRGVEALKNRTYWKRVVLTDFGSLNEQYTGTLHHVMAGPETLPGSFTVACIGVPIGTPENQGVYIYTAVDLTKGEFKRVKITDLSAGRVAVTDFSRSTSSQGRDIASISYYVLNDFTGLCPPNVRINTLPLASRSLQISASKHNKDILFRIPRPSAIPVDEYRSLSFWILAGKRITLVVLPPSGKYNFGEDDAAKVIFGEITYRLEESTVTRGIAPAAKSTASTLVPSTIEAGDIGAVFLHLEYLHDQFQGPYSKMSDVTSLNVLPNNENVSDDARMTLLPFLKVDTLDWASNGLWNDFEFYNVTGFNVCFNNYPWEHVVHIQAWTLGLGETARFHNHSELPFCEIHLCISNGDQAGGMRYFRDDYTQPIDQNEELTKSYVEANSDMLIVPNMHEHGPLWKIQQCSQARPVIRIDNPLAVEYPWHAWLASRFGDWSLPIIPPLPSSQQKYDVWMAFEFPSSAFQY